MNTSTPPDNSAPATTPLPKTHSPPLPSAPMACSSRGSKRSSNAPASAASCRARPTAWTWSSQRWNHWSRARPTPTPAPARKAPPPASSSTSAPTAGQAAAVTARGERKLAPAQVAAAGCDARVEQAGRRNHATIPSKVRSAVLARDRDRCATPGCGAAHFLEVHHVIPRGQGGSNKADNLVTLCSRCHRFAHEQGAHVGIAPAQVGAAGLAP
ncbi:MAG: HNH endonuclease [bacterium]|nr:HNH endonuclease [bacterium]